jgi:hypothetical protein
MEIRPLYLLSYFVAVAYMIAWLVRLSLAFYHWLRKAGLGRLLAGQRISMNPLGRNLPWNSIFLAVSGAVFGWAVISWEGAWFVREWLLLILPGLGILGNELRLTTKNVYLLAVMALIAGLHDQREVGLDVFERLARVVDGLPPGEVQKAVREALQRRRSGLLVEQSCQVLNRLHPFLDELVFTLRLTGYQAIPAFDLAIKRLGQRAGKQWDCVSRSMVFREQIQPFLRFGQAAILAALAALVIEDIPAFTLAWPSYTVIGWIGLGCVLAAGVLYAASSRAWLRRSLGAAFLIASVVPLWQYASLPRLFELQLHSVTHLSEDVANKRVEPEPVRATDVDPTISNSALENQVENNTSFTRPTATPTLPTMVEIQLQPLALPSQSIEVDKTWLIHCCQPR